MGKLLPGVLLSTLTFNMGTMNPPIDILKIWVGASKFMSNSQSFSPTKFTRSGEIFGRNHAMMEPA